MVEYIDKDIAIKGLLLGHDIDGADFIESLPAVDAVEVVRCADCKHWDGPDDGYTHSCDVDAWVRPGWWFCPAGQRREDGTDA